MGRRRREEDDWMPDKVYRGKVQFEYRPTKKYCIKLGKLDTEHQTIIERAAEERRKFLTDIGTVEAMMDEYFVSAKFLDLSPRTKSDYQNYWNNLKSFFKGIDRNKIEPKMIWKYAEIKKQKSGVVQANRHLAFIKLVFKWGHARGYLKSDPALAVDKFKETPRETYIEDREYLVVYRFASLSTRVVMEISYLCAARQQDVLALRKAQVTDLGIFIRQGKTGKKQIKRWTPRLLNAILNASKLPYFFQSDFVVSTTRDKSRYTSDGFRSNWDAARTAARESSGQPLKFTFHDIKAKGISDFEGDKQKFSGHKTFSQVQVYDRKVQIVDTLDAPIIEGI
jgi:hypothetical protein